MHRKRNKGKEEKEYEKSKTEIAVMDFGGGDDLRYAAGDGVGGRGECGAD